MLCFPIAQSMHMEPPPGRHCYHGIGAVERRHKTPHGQLKAHSAHEEHVKVHRALPQQPWHSTCVAPVADARVPARAVDAAGVGRAAGGAAHALIDVNVAVRALVPAFNITGLGWSHAHAVRADKLVDI